MFIEINTKSKKWLVSCSYNPNISKIQNHLKYLSMGLDFCSSKYENFILMGDFNADLSNNSLSEFCSIFDLKSLIREPTCFKNIANPSCIDLILTNRPRCFQHSGVYETGLSDFHKLTFSVIKKYFQKQKPKIIKYRDYKSFNNDLFRNEVVEKLPLPNISVLANFKNKIKEIIDKHIPIKLKYLRNNDGGFMNKELHKAIMARSRLLNKHRKDNSTLSKIDYNKQRNICVKLLRKSKKDFYNNLNAKSITDSKSFWKTVKPSFSDKPLKNETISLIEKDLLK